MSELDVQLAGKSLADYTNTQLRLALGAVLYTNTADMWRAYLEQQGYTGSVADMLAKYYIDNNVPAQFRNYINAGLYLFTPRQLFLDGSKGVIFDNADLSSFFLDSNGVTPATVNGLVGLQLDKSANLALSAERLTNGDFSSGTGWTLATGGGGTAVISGGLLSLAGGSATFPNATQSAVLTIGKLYRITIVTTSSVTAGSIGVRVGSVSNNGPNLSTAGTYTATVLADGVDFRIIRNSGYTDALDVDSVSIQEISGNHRYQTTTGSKPVLRGTPTGANLVTNGDFASGTGWTAGSGWAIGSGVATATASSGILLSGNAVVAGKVYRITFTTSSYSAGSLQVRLGGASAGFFSQNGTAVFYVTASTTTGLEFVSTGLTQTIDNVEVVDVSAGQVTAPYGLQYDGVDDFMQTAAVDFTATDKMFVCAGVRKLSDAATALILELGANSSVASSSFGFQGPSVSGANKFNFNTSGTIVVVPAATTTTYNAPYLGVLTGVGNIAGDSAILRINGVEIQSLALDQGTGNYRNDILYFGRRGGTSIPYNGLDFGMVICGKTLTSTQISQTERYIAQRTGIVL